MKLFRPVAVALCLATVGCGVNTQEKQDEVQNEQPEEEVATVIAKVPVDADGNELTDQIEMRVAQGDREFTTEVAAEEAFHKGEKAGVTDELDEDTSAESWHRRGYRRHGYWNTPHYPGKWLGRGLWWGRNPYLKHTRFRSHGYHGQFGGHTPYYYRARYYYPKYRYYTWCNRRAYSHGRHRTDHHNGFGSGFNGTSYHKSSYTYKSTGYSQQSW